MSKKVLGFKVSNEDYDIVNKYCKDKGVSVQSYLESIVRPYLNQLKLLTSELTCKKCNSKIDSRGIIDE